MREVNFSIPNANKASVGITAALYDRRALDCTSTLPLINSLNHLAYLTTSSARIRDILTVDGGVERLVVILKEGRSKDLMSMWKWNLAFQCVVNIGVRGSEIVRTRVVEADMVPVIATILNNYIQAVDKIRAKQEAAAVAKRNSATARARENRATSFDRSFVSADRGIRRTLAPHTIDIPPPVPNTQLERAHAEFLGVHGHRQTVHPLPATERARFPSYGRLQERRHFDHYSGNAGPPIMRLDSSMEPLAAALPSVDVSMAGFGGLQNVRDVLPSMSRTGGPSQPVSPTTPNPPITGQPYNSRIAPRNGRLAIRHQRSMSGESDGADSDELPNTRAPIMVAGSEPMVDIQTGVDMDGDVLLESVDAPMTLAGPHGTDTQDTETFNITHRSPLDGSTLNPVNNPQGGFSPNPPANPALGLPASLLPSRFMLDTTNTLAYPAMPREEDVLMSLQLLAYVSKYCDLREYFQKSHLVPSLSITKDLHLLDPDSPASPAPQCCEEDEELDEYLLPDDFNIFPLVEKFTVRHHSQEMQYWAGVVMRNLCRKDDARGGIRQCAHYECGKWEEFTRQFAKCRRCRRTKYCSKECQKKAWVYHRHWCVAAQP